MNNNIIIGIFVIALLGLFMSITETPIEIQEDIQEAPIVIQEYNTGAIADYTTNNLIGHWRFDGDATDASSYGNDGVVIGGTVVDGKFAEAYNFSKYSNYITISDFEELYNMETFTYSYWTKLDKYSEAGVYQVAIGNPNSGIFAIGTDIGNGKILFQTGTLTQGAMYSTGEIPIDEWTHVTGVYDGTKKYIYINGVLDSFEVATGTIINSGDTYIGTYAKATTHVYSGIIDEMRMYNTSLTADEVLEIYNQEALSGKFSLKGSADEGLTDGLVGHWDFDGNALDSTSFENDGTVVIATLTEEGKFNEAYYYDGGSSLIDMGESAVLNWDATQLNKTISGWFKTVAIDNDQFIIIKRDSWAEGEYVLRVQGNNIDARFWIDDSGAYTISCPGLEINTWQLATATISGTAAIGGTWTTTLYLDGEQCNQRVDVGDVNTFLTSDFKIGVGFNGSIDEVRIYNRSLSDNEVSQLYNTSKNTKKFTLKGSTYESVTDGLTGYYKLDGNVLDSSSEGNDGTNHGATETVGKFGGAYEFDGTSDYIVLSNTTTLLTQSDNWTTSTWFNTNDIHAEGYSNRILFLAKTDEVALSGFSTYLEYPTNLRFLFYNSGNGLLSAEISPIDLNTWYNVVVSYNGTEFAYYLNGDKKGTFVSTFKGFGSAYALLGASAASAPAKFSGKIDEARIYDRTLSDDEVLQLYNDSLSTKRFSIYGNPTIN